MFVASFLTHKEPFPIRTEPKGADGYQPMFQGWVKHGLITLGCNTGGVLVSIHIVSIHRIISELENTSMVHQTYASHKLSIGVSYQVYYDASHGAQDSGIHGTRLGRFLVGLISFSPGMHQSCQF